ncbi:hypothetical protein [Nostoc flagelliforme]|uniref:hypothetical protein n=1 Tax=Nostoc flagelliforme TaxID=1306274 RepID=UPI0012FE3783|nr:hypothetical protein [Nostoc flagelliforme]
MPSLTLCKSLSRYVDASLACLSLNIAILSSTKCIFQSCGNDPIIRVDAYSCKASRREAAWCQTSLFSHKHKCVNVDRRRRSHSLVVKELVIRQ